MKTMRTEHEARRLESRPRKGGATVHVFVLSLLIAVAIGGIHASSADAQPDRRGGPRVIQLEEFRIEGEVQKPNAFYILNRSNLGYEVLDLRTSFLRELVRSVGQRPF